MQLSEILAGPMLRRAEPRAVCVWLATSERCRVRVVVRRDGTSPEEPTLGAAEARQVRLGPNLYVHLATVTPDAGTLPTDVLLAYDVEVTNGGGETRDLAGLGLVGGPHGITYGDRPMPTFFLPGTGTPALKVLHGSCRMLHGQGEDAFLAADETMDRTAEDLAERPSALFLTGDQVYADEVGGPLIGHLTRLGAALLGPGDDTSVPGLPPLSSIPVYGRQALVEERARFTSGKAANHLCSLGEFAAAYLVAWNEGNWPQRWPDAGTAVPDGQASSRERAKLVRQYQDEIACLDVARQAVPACRRVLANAPTYACFDDHDVTDDWNLTRQWQEQVRASPTGRRMVANALAAFWAFQGWGNQPDTFDDAFIEAVAAGPGAGPAERDRFDETLWAFDRWSFAAPTQPPVIVLDTRTQRAFDSDHGAARLISASEAQRVCHLAAEAGLPSASGPAVLVSAVPIFGLELQERRQKFLVGRLGPYEIDFEAWHSNLQGFVDFMRVLIDEVGLRRCIVLSGDVHYGINVEASFRADDAELAVAQVVSSSFKHSGTFEKSALHLLGRLVRGGHERVGWDRPPELTSSSSFARRLLERRVNTDEWSDDSPLFLAPRLEQRIGCEEHPPYRETRSYVDPEERPGWVVIGENNVGLLSIEGDHVVHRLLARSTRHETTTYTARMSLPASD